MGRKPQGPQALTGAERQARYRARHEAPAGGAACVMPRHRPPTAARTAPRVRRWQAAVGQLVALQAEYAAWLAALPEATRDGATGEALQAIIDLDLDEIMTIQPPRGFGRD
jgi:hypothetical protein